MKKLFTILTTVIFTVVVFAQSPQKMSYQAVIRNSSNGLVATSPIGMKISILQGSASGTAVYIETHTPTTNANGLVTVEIGGGTPVSGTLAGINWSAGPYFIKTETATAAPLTTYTVTGTSELLSVPYALHAKTVASYTETDPVFIAHAANGITGTNITNWNTSYSWGNHTGLYRPIGYVPSWSDITSNPFSFSSVADGQMLKYNGTTSKWENVAPSSISETDPVFGAWDKTTDISITSSQVTDFASSVAGNAAVALNTAKVTNATHTGDATGAEALTVVRINGISLAGLTTGILKNTTTTGAPSIAVAGTDYLAPSGSASLLTDFPTLNQNTTGSAASFTGSLAGEVTGTQGATVVGNAAVIGKVLTGYASAPGTVAATDNILQAIQKLNGNIGSHFLGEAYLGGIIFDIYKGSDGLEHGLVVALTEQQGLIWQSIPSLTAADRSWDGTYNTPLMINSPAATYVASLGAGWYVPSIDELKILWYNRFYVNKALNAGGHTLLGSAPNGNSDYWSSTELDATRALDLWFFDGKISYTPKADDPGTTEIVEGTITVRAIKAF